ncbi:MAG: hypothetical protein A3F68_11105 [Acidobacteria bacterium RIFCSPLOWO2_12_FULL_54_10]|nr:MAG: hypothetical protein A3F68_11105 [Acidobacteria bacterium RIFCSPLOWO2_12_FULL_54_10]
MKIFRQIARHLATATAGRDKWFIYGAMLLLNSLTLGPSVQGSSMLAPEQVITRMEQQLVRQMETLGNYEARRRYAVASGAVGDRNYLVVKEQYTAREGKQFQVLERGGSKQVEKRVFTKLMEAEQENACGKAREEVSMNRHNYKFTFSRYDTQEHAYVFAVEPRTENRYLLRGTIWVDDKDFGVRRIEGEPAVKPSVFVRKTHFIHEFAKFGDYWLPVRHRSETDVALIGRSTLEIDYFDYEMENHKEERP